MDERKDQLNSQADSQDRNSDQIRADIEQTRTDLDETVEALQDKLQPQQMIDQAMEYLRSAGEGIPSRLIETVRNNPIPVALIAGGLTWLVIKSAMNKGSSEYGYGSGQASQRYGKSGGLGGKLSHAGQSIAHGASAAADKVKDAAGTAAHKVRDAAQYARQSAGQMAYDSGGKIKGGLRSVSGKVREKASQAKVGFWDTYTDHPLGVSATAMALGLAAGLGIPSTRPESSLMGSTRDHLMKRAKEVGKDALERGRSAAQSAVSAVREVVVEAASGEGQGSCCQDSQEKNPGQQAKNPGQGPGNAKPV